MVLDLHSRENRVAKNRRVECEINQNQLENVVKNHVTHLIMTSSSRHARRMWLNQRKYFKERVESMKFILWERRERSP